MYESRYVPYLIKLFVDHQWINATIFSFTKIGDIAKAFGAGADFVMLGGMLAGHDQSGGETIVKDDKKFKCFYGMSSSTAMDKHHGGVAEYRASEGKTVEVPYRGDVKNTMNDILGGIRSACTYTGSSKLWVVIINLTCLLVHITALNSQKRDQQTMYVHPSYSADKRNIPWLWTLMK